MKKNITEEMAVHTEWYREAKNMKLDNLTEFINKLMNDYNHDYGTICHALTAGGIATMWAMNNEPHGGITGFQAGHVMWEFIKNWQYSSNKCGLKMVDYDNFLYPQYEYKYQKTISKDVWNNIKKQAEEGIERADTEYKKYLDDVEQYKIDVKNYLEKYPDYYERKDYYDKLSYGTGKQWDENSKKEKNGFEFAPSEPFNHLYGNGVYLHWKSIVDGVIPFGYVISEDD